MLSEAERAALVAKLRRGRGAAAPARIPRRAGDRTALPLSFGQEQLWFVDRFAPGMATYNVPVALRVSGALDLGALGEALARLAERHEALRTRLATGPDGAPVQVIDPPGPVALDLAADLSGLGADERPGRLRDLLDAEAVRPFDLAAGPLLRAMLVTMADDEHVLLVMIHHVVFDGWSIGLLVSDLAALYAAAATGQPAGLDDLPVQFADYAVWERDYLQGSALAKLEDYWRKALEGVETLQFPTDRPRPVLDDFTGALADCTTSPALLAGLRELSRHEGTTLFNTLLAGLLALLHRYTGQGDLVVGTVSANRGRPELAPLIGYLVNTLPIRVDAAGDPTFSELVTRVKDATVGAFAHQDLPFGKLVDTLGIPRDASRAPVFQIAFAIAEPNGAVLDAAGAKFSLSDAVRGINAAKFDLMFATEPRADGLWIEISYKTALFDAATVRRLLAHLEMVLDGAVADPSARISRLPLLTDAERRAEVTGWNDTDAEANVACVHELFEARAARDPEAIAARYEDARVTYAGLNAQANQVARRLRDLGVGPESLVGVCMPAGLRRLAALLAIMKAGGAYVPLDPALPAERLAFMAADTAMTVIVTDAASLAQARAAGPAAVVDLDAEWAQLQALDPANVTGTGVTPASLAYLLYTSGSTGQPKGVMVEHRNLANMLHGVSARYDISPDDVILQFSALTFDVSVLDMFMSLTSGARLLLASSETLHSPPRLAALLRDAGVTVAFLTPAVLALLPDRGYPDLRVLLLGGEEFPSALARRWARPGLRLVNGYGPTEATVVSTLADITPQTPLPPPIGYPVWPNYQVYVLDPHLNPVPVGVAGELHVGGASVARGYLNRPELTRERFIPDPFRPGGRLYKTGDLARRRPDGSLAYAGRIDHQVKIHGVRMELGEIEAALEAHPGIGQAVVTVVTGAGGDKELAAYLRLAPAGSGSGSGSGAGAGDEGLSPDEVRAHLGRTLPAVMIPAHFVTLADFPLNPSGKVDKQALPAPQRAAATARVEPATPAEAMLAGLYGELLGGQAAGATDSFFDLGGNSLSAMRLVDLVSREAGVDLGVSAVFLNPTPRRLAAALAAADASGARPGPVVALTEGRDLPPAFLLHPVGGTVSAYASLARELADDFTVYGLQSPALAGDPVPESLPALAQEYTRLVREAQPAGPYRLAGWSMGGVLAFEVARRLEAAGAEVELLAMLDPPFAFPEGNAADAGELAGRFVLDALHGLGLDAASAPDPAVAPLAEQLRWLARQVPGGAGAAADPAGGDGHDGVAAQLEQRYQLFAAHNRMLAGYQPGTEGVRAATLIVSARNSPNAPAAARWQGLLSEAPVSVLPVDSDHYAFLRPPLVADVAATIRKWHGGHPEDGADGR
jgi:amino acid adenylation domain-containing protein